MQSCQLAELESWVRRGRRAAYISFDGLVGGMCEVGEVGEICRGRHGTRLPYGSHGVVVLGPVCDLHRKNRAGGFRLVPAERHDGQRSLGLGLTGPG